MFTERTDKVFRQILAFVYISADITYPAFFIGFRFWLHIVLIVRVCHRFDIRKLDALRHFTDEYEFPDPPFPLRFRKYMHWHALSDTAVR